jgi:hypothetical protein
MRCNAAPSKRKSSAALRLGPRSDRRQIQRAANTIAPLAALPHRPEDQTRAMGARSAADEGKREQPVGR